MKVFDVPLSSTYLVVTITVCLVISFSLFFIVNQVLQSAFTFRSIVLLAIGVSLLLGMIFLAAIQPRSLSVSEDSVIIQRWLGQVEICRKDIILVRRKNQIWKDSRNFGSGGLFGYIGYFSSKSEGKYFAYVKDSKSMVYIQTKDQNYVVSCEKSDELIDELTK